jgi:hypothetical protein
MKEKPVSTENLKATKEDTSRLDVRLKTIKDLKRRVENIEKKLGLAA